MGGTWRGTGDGLMRAAALAASRPGAQPAEGGVRRRCRTQRVSGPAGQAGPGRAATGPEVA